jgi:ABC-type transport system involved in multi-copper enzyme maturation permease subunit
MGFLGEAAIAGEESRGGLEVTLSAPVARGQVLAGRATALLIDITAVTVATGLSMWVFSLGMHLGVAAITSAAAALGIFGLFAEPLPSPWAPRPAARHLPAAWPRSSPSPAT